jgi:hypothetical protein
VRHVPSAGNYLLECDDDNESPGQDGDRGKVGLAAQSASPQKRGKRNCRKPAHGGIKTSAAGSVRREYDGAKESPGQHGDDDRGQSHPLT